MKKSKCQTLRRSAKPDDAGLLCVFLYTGSILSASWYSRLSDIAYHETEIVGVGSSQYKRLPYVRVLQLRFQNQTIYLQDVDICDKLYGQPPEIEALLGYDFLEGRD